MKTTAITIMTLLSVGLAYGKSELPAVDQTVTVCLESGRVGAMTVSGGKILASTVFRQIGISIKWQRDSRNCPAEAIRVKLGEETPSSLKPGALAYALPYEGVHIEVFYDRISYQFNGSMVEIVLAHVFVHEITHILQGVTRHSENGVMKARWNTRDFDAMRRGPLGFTQEDIDLIYQGLAARRQPAVLAMNSDQSRATRAR